MAPRPFRARLESLSASRQHRATATVALALLLAVLAPARATAFPRLPINRRPLLNQRHRSHVHHQSPVHQPHRSLVSVLPAPFAPFPGRLKCRLTANLDADKVYGGGEFGSDSRLIISVYNETRLIISVYKFKQQVVVKLHLRYHSSIAFTPPVSQSIRIGDATTANGAALWSIDGPWVRSDTDAFSLVTWVRDAARYKPEGSSQSVYAMVKRISRSWYRRGFYVRVDTMTKPNGALRGQLHRGWATMFIPFNVC